MRGKEHFQQWRWKGWGLGEGGNEERKGVHLACGGKRSKLTRRGLGVVMGTSLSINLPLDRSRLSPTPHSRLHGNMEGDSELHDDLQAPMNKDYMEQEQMTSSVGTYVGP